MVQYHSSFPTPLIVMHRIGHFAVLLAMQLLLNMVSAIVIDLPTPQNSGASCLERMQPTIISTRTRKTQQFEFRVRKTKSSDIDAISTMLATASTCNTELSGWKQGVEMLRVKSSLEKQLQHRFNAVQEGKRTIASYKKLEFSEECSLDSELCHLLWSNDNFRHKLRMAVNLSSERNAWEDHNFDLTPSDPSIFNHAMLTVVQTNKHKCADDVIGFCEIAWLPCPTSSYDTAMQCSPSIVNLVTSSSHRRKGIASRLIDVASRYARTQWVTNYDATSSLAESTNRLGLYVHPENESAIYLYVRKGFRVDQVGANGLLYMRMMT